MKASLLLSIIACFNYQMICAQISGRVIDKVTKEGIPYVSIWVENGNNGATAEEDGKFSLKTNEENNKLIFSALGYEKRILAGSKDMVVELEPSAIQLNEVVLVKKYGTKVIEIGETESPFLKAYENGPRIDIKLFPYSEKYKKTKFIKQLIINTDCRINEAMIKLHLYRVDPNGLPGEELFTKDFVVSVSKGVKRTIFNLSSLHLVMPKEGVFAGFERLKIESNAYEKSVFDANTQSVIVQTSYCPFILYNTVERNYNYVFSEGEWQIDSKIDKNNSPIKSIVYEPAINLVLTN